MQVLIDSSVFIAESQYKINVFGQLNELIDGKKEFITLSTVKGELERLGEKESVRGLNTRIALKLLSKVNIVEVEGFNVDDSIVSYAEKNKCVVCTDDRELKSRLLKKGVRTIIIKGRRRLDFA